jgi:glycosyltransferase involved in cell wall biosynthesis
MKIAYVYDAVYPWVKGGAEKRVFELSRRLANRGHEVHCFGIKWWKENDVILKDGVYLHGICRPRDLYSGERRSMREAMAFAGKVLFSLRGDYDLIDCQEFPYIPCFSARIAAMANKSDLFITWHEVWGEYWYEYLGKIGFIGKSIETVTSRLTDNNIAVSERTKRQLEGLGISKVQVVPNGIDIREIEKIEASEKNSDIIYVGRLIGHKNVDILIRAVDLVKQQIPDVKAVIIGDGPDAANLKRLVADLGLEENVEFAGFVEDYDQALARMKSSGVFVMPSIREGFGLAAVEAHACGLPVVTVNHRMNAVCDMVNEDTGVICGLSREELSAAIISVLNRDRSRMRNECINQARKYDWNKICSHIEKVYTKSAN